jgi:glycosyltransferase involved in cell wall biosynthesis
MNGYDDDPLPGGPRDSRFLVAYTGSVLLDRSPRILFRAIARAVRDLRLTSEEFGIQFMGDALSHNGISLETLAEQEGLRDIVRVYPARSRREAMELLARASLLVSLPQDAHLAIPSKVFEYLRFNAWILAMAEEGSATELVLRETGARVVRPDDVEGIADFVTKCYQDHCVGRQPPRAVSDERLSRRVQARRLFDAIDRIVSRS